MSRLFDVLIAEIAGRQRGYITHAQLIGIGLSKAAIANRVMTGRLHRIHRGVYAVGVPSKDIVDHARAAVLACDDSAALTHGSSIAHWAFHDRWRWERPFHVVARTARRRPGIVVHRSRSLDWRDVTVHHGIRVTKPARAILDYASELNDKQLTRLVNDARHARFRLTDNAIADVLGRVPTHPNARRLAPFADLRGRRATRSGQEDDFPAWCLAYDLPEPVMDAVVYGIEVDAWFERERVVIELDGWEFHRWRDAFERDRDRDAELLTMYDIPTVRVTKRRVDEAPEREAKRLHQLFRRRRGSS
jgi:hypothetical protein